MTDVKDGYLGIVLRRKSSKVVIRNGLEHVFLGDNNCKRMRIMMMQMKTNNKFGKKSRSIYSRKNENFKEKGGKSRM